MPPPAFLTGVLSGFTKRAAESRLLARQDQEAQDKKETDILSELTKSDNPDISHAAITGLLDIASGQKKPKGGYLARLMGPNETTIHPAVTSMMQLIKGGTRTEIPAPTLGSMSIGQAPTPSSTPSGTIPTPPPAAGAAAMPPPPNKPGGGITPPTGGVQVGTPPDLQPVPNHPDTTIPAGPPLQFGSTGRPAGPPTVIRTPTHIFDTPEEKAIKLSRAKSQGDVEGEVAGLVTAGFSDTEARDLVKQKYARQARGLGTTRPVPGTLGDGRTPAYAVFDPATKQFLDADTQQPIPDFMPAQSTGSTRSPLDDISMLPEYGGVKYAQNTPANRARVDAESRRRVGETAFNRQTGVNNANAIRPFNPQEIFSNENDLRNNLERYIGNARETLILADGVNDAHRQLTERLEEGKSIGAQSEVVISNFKRITDIMSAVRNEEYNRSALNQSAFDRFDGWITKVLQGGGGLAKAEIDNIVQLVNGIMERRKQFIKDQATATYRAGQRPGFDVNRFMTPEIQQLIGVQGGGGPPAGPEGVTKGMLVGMPKLNEQRMNNGQPIHWDGKGWVAGPAPIIK